MPRNLTKWQEHLITFIAFLMGLYNVYTLTFAVYDIFAHMAVNLAFVLPLVFLTFPARKKDISKIPWYDYVLAVVSVIPHSCYTLTTLHGFTVGGLS